MSNPRPIPHFTSADARASALQKVDPMNPTPPAPLSPEELERLIEILADVVIRLGALEDRLSALEFKMSRYDRLARR